MSGRRDFSLSSSAILRMRARRSTADDESCGRRWAKCSSREGSSKLLKSSGYSDNHVLNTVDTALKKVGLKSCMSIINNSNNIYHLPNAICTVVVVALRLSWCFFNSLEWLGLRVRKNQSMPAPECSEPPTWKNHLVIIDAALLFSFSLTCWMTFSVGSHFLQEGSPACLRKDKWATKLRKTEKLCLLKSSVCTDIVEQCTFAWVQLNIIDTTEIRWWRHVARC